MKPLRYAEGKGSSSVDSGGGDKPTADTMPDGDAVPVMSQLDLQASTFAVSPEAFAPVAVVVPAVVAPIHDGASRWSKNVVAPQPRRQRGVIGK